MPFESEELQEQLNDLRAEAEESGYESLLENSQKTDNVSLREAVQKEKARRAAEEAKKNNTLPGRRKWNRNRQITGEFLAASWKNIVTSFGFSVFYVYIHIFLRQIFGDSQFCKLGQEWDMPGLYGKGTPGDPAPDTKMLEIVESIGAGVCCFGCLSIVLGILVLIHILLNPGEFFVGVVKDFF